LTPSHKADAQRRADRINAFREELAELAREGASPFDEEALAAVARHHDRLLRTLARDFDVDRGAAEKRMSIGMRLASLLGAAALTAAVVSFVYRVWGSLPTAGQVTLLTAAPVVATTLMIVAGRLEKTRYVASLLAIVACGAVVMQTIMLGMLFNMRGSPHVLAAWALFAFAVALPWRLGVPFAWGTITLICYIAALRLWTVGGPWAQFPEALEPIVVGAAVVFAAHRWMPRELAGWGRGAALAMLLGAVLVLSSADGMSELPLTERTREIVYQVFAIVIGPALIAAGLHNRWPEVIVLAAVFTGLFILVRFVDWWWDWMPKYLFFLILTAVALAWLWGLRVVRRRLAAADA
jgi:hypothetical protein